MLRELKKRVTRQAISDVATRLFIEHGFDEVTIAQVAAAANVAKMTVTNHFPRKEDLVFDIHEEFAASLSAALTEDEPVLAALRRNYFDALDRRDAMAGFSGPEFARMILGSHAEPPSEGIRSQGQNETFRFGTRRSAPWPPNRHGPGMFRTRSTGWIKRFSLEPLGYGVCPSVSL
jgi:AcrR family transcriptional regulator